MMPLWYAILLSLACAYFGFWYGRSRNWGLLETGMGKPVAEKAGETGKEQREHPGNRHSSDSAGKTGSERTVAEVFRETDGRILPQVRYLASPTGGRVERLTENGKRGVRIQTTESKLYAPSSGRILWIAPRGNAFLMMTDWGDEVEVRACNSEDDLLDRYFRPRVVRGEIVRRGKLLLEYDREKLSRECTDTAVYLTSRGEEQGPLELAAGEEVRAGEALLWVN